MENKIKNIHDLTTFYCIGEHNEVFISGKDENGENITLVFNAFEFIDTVDIEHIKAKVISYIENLNN